MSSNINKPDKDSKVMVFLVYYRTAYTHKKIKEIIGKVTPEINYLRGCVITDPYDGKETENLWDTIKKLEKKKLEKIRKLVVKLKEEKK